MPGVTETSIMQIASEHRWLYLVGEVTALGHLEPEHEAVDAPVGLACGARQKGCATERLRDRKALRFSTGHT